MYSRFLDQNISEQTFLVADPQFGCRYVFEHVPARRLFASMNKLHNKLVDNWNSLVTESDVILCLGDFTKNNKHALKSKRQVEHFSKLLNGKKILIRGNHDVEDTQFYYDCGWSAVIEFPLLFTEQNMQWLNVPSQNAGCIIKEIAGLRILFSHFAIFDQDDDDCRYLIEKAYLRELFKSYQCDINIHGHTHDRHIADPRCFSVCVEKTFFAPILLGDFLDHQLIQSHKKIA